MQGKSGDSGEKMISQFRIESLIGEGAYGIVYKGLHNDTKQYVAIKQIKLEEMEQDEGIPSTAIREISIVKNLKHPNLVKLIDVYQKLQSKKLFMIFEYVESDLKKFMEQHGSLDQTTQKSIMYQLLLGVDHCHANRILHRDLKPSNILISASGVVKICDFGLARTFSMPQGKFTKEIATLWYRAPELMLGDSYYSISVDIWSLGCIFAEIVKKSTLFNGSCQIDMLFQIFEVFGTPTELTYPSVSKLPEFKVSFPKFLPQGLEKQFAHDVDRLFIDLLAQMLQVDPRQRITARQALAHPFFDSLDKKPF